MTFDAFKKNPIGYFGTGLKYAISVLCRLGTKPVVWIGQDKYTFYTQDGRLPRQGFRANLDAVATLEAEGQKRRTAVHDGVREELATLDGVSRA
jgi:hypothetical protein